jgi:hypothetical protein
LSFLGKERSMPSVEDHLAECRLELFILRASEPPDTLRAAAEDLLEHKITLLEEAVVHRCRPAAIKHFFGRPIFVEV